jgi:hypothetical protein
MGWKPMLRYNPPMTLFSIVQIIYWISLSTWFGGVLFVAMAAPIIFRVVREQKPLLPMVLSVNLENQHAELLAGTIVGNLLAMLGRVELVCAGGVLVGLIGQWTLTDHGPSGPLTPIIIRVSLFVAATAMVVYDWRIVWPRISKYHQEYVEHADEPEIANLAKENFDRYHRESVNVLSIVLLLLLGLVLFSGNITNVSPGPTYQMK